MQRRMCRNFQCCAPTKTMSAELRSKEHSSMLFQNIELTSIFINCIELEKKLQWVPCSFFTLQACDFMMKQGMPTVECLSDWRIATPSKFLRVKLNELYSPHNMSVDKPRGLDDPHSVPFFSCHPFKNFLRLVKQILHVQSRMGIKLKEVSVYLIMSADIPSS